MQCHIYVVFFLIIPKNCRSVSSLQKRISELVPQKQAELQKLKQKHGELHIDDVTVDQGIGGMRGINCMFWDISHLDEKEGIRFRGYTIPELQQKLPTAKKGGEPLPEAMLWLLMTGEIPTQEQARSVTAELHERAKLPSHVEASIRAFPKAMHPMTQFSSAVLALQTESEFAKAYHKHVHKNKYWEYTYEDVLNLIARLPRVAALIYRCTFHDGKIPNDDTSLDFAANFNRLLGFPGGGRGNAMKAKKVSPDDFDDCMRLYLSIHADHEGGNVSAHATRLAGSALSDPYLSFSAGMNGLAGPLHGLANQEVLRWTLDFQEKIKSQGKEITKKAVEEEAWATLNAGNVIPGFGHAVLRQTDPRYMSQREFALKHLPHDPLFKLVSIIFEVVPQVLLQQRKVKNPWPNVDAHSGCLLNYYGLTEFDFYTVLFGVSRAFGVLSQLVYDRIWNLPIERPKSFTLAFVEEFAKKKEEGAKKWQQ